MPDNDLSDVAELKARVTEIHEMLSGRNLTDHDLLIRLNTLSEGVRQDLGDLKTGIIQQVSGLDTRVRALEQARWQMMGAAGVIGAIAGLLVELIVGFLAKR